MKNVVLSVIIPYYKGLNYIEKTVNSVKTINNTKEIIIIDDGSDDGSFDKLKELFTSDSEVVLHTKRNGGIADTKNFGLERAGGKYLFFCDQDDIVVGKTIDKAIDRLEENNVDAAFFSTEIFYEENRPNKPCDTVLVDKVLDASKVKSELLVQTLLHRPSQYCTQFMHLWMGVYRRDFIVDNLIGFKNFVDIEDDFLFIVDVMSDASKVCLLPDVGYMWLQNRQSKSHTTKSIERYMDKSSNLFAYYREVVGEAGVETDISAEVDRYCDQIQVVEGLYEWARLPKGELKNSEKEKLLAAMTDRRAKGSFERYALGDFKRDETIWKYVHEGKYALAFSYMTLWNHYFEFRKRAGAFVWGKLR